MFQVPRSRFRESQKGETVMSMEERIAELERRRAAAERGGNDRIEEQHRAGKLTARERLRILFDEGTFEEIDHLLARGGDGVITGHGTIDGRPACVFAQDGSVLGGSLSPAGAARMVKVMELALKMGVPVIGLYDSAGLRLREGLPALAGCADLLLRQTLASGVVPQLAAVLGPCIGAAAFSPALADFVIIARETSSLFVTGPEVVLAVTGEEVTAAELGGAAVHSEISGAAHFTGADDEECLLLLRELFSFLPPNNEDDPPVRSGGDRDRRRPALRTLVPEDPCAPYDMREVLREVVDDGFFFEVQQRHAGNLVAGFARLDGRPVGIIANQPDCLAGVLDGDAAVKGARFVRFCDAFNIPLVAFEDLPGFLPGVRQDSTPCRRRRCQSSPSSSARRSAAATA
jgi:propionyl-CoA carboxylase beta chain